MICVLVAACGGSNDEPTKARAASEPPRATNVELPSEKIAFRRYLDDARTHGAIFTMNADATEQKQITEPASGYVDDHPDWSPDGRRIAFERCGGVEPCQVFTVTADGGSPREVTARCELKPICDLTHPAWTPDGRLLVRLSQGRERTSPATGEQWIQQSSVELLDPERGTQRTIVERRNWTGDAGTPAMSPDRRTIIYTRWNSWRSRPADGLAIYAVDRDGSDHRRLTPWKLGAGDHPSFSPDGTVLFRSNANKDTAQSDYWTVRTDGRDLSRLTHSEQGTLRLSTSYSPDGEWIVHATDGVGGNADVFVMRADGTDNQPLTRSKLWDSAPDWGPPDS